MTLWYLSLVNSSGWNYVAKDKTGAVYLFCEEPLRAGAYWEPVTGDIKPQRSYHSDFGWLEAGTSVKIETVLPADKVD